MNKKILMMSMVVLCVMQSNADWVKQAPQEKPQDVSEAQKKEAIIAQRKAENEARLQAYKAQADAAMAAPNAPINPPDEK